MKIPPQAKQVFKGMIFDVYQWEQEMYDGSHHTFEMLKRPSTIQILAIQDGKILITHESQPNKPDFYSFPGGRAEENEDPLDTAKRELLEETGLSSSDWELYKVYDPLHKIEWNVYYFIARDCKKKQEPSLDAGEQITIVPMEFDKFMDFITSGKYNADAFTVDMIKTKFDNVKRQAFKSKLGI